MSKVKRFNVIVILAFVCMLSNNVLAAESDPFDLSQYEESIEEIGIHTQTSIKSIKEQAINAYNEGDDEAAIELLEQWAKSANWMANLISSGL